MKRIVGMADLLAQTQLPDEGQQEYVRTRSDDLRHFVVRLAQRYFGFLFKNRARKLELRIGRVFESCTKSKPPSHASAIKAAKERTATPHRCRSNYPPLPPATPEGSGRFSLEPDRNVPSVHRPRQRHVITANDCMIRNTHTNGQTGGHRNTDET